MTIERSGSATRTPATLPSDPVQGPTAPVPSGATTGAEPSGGAPAPLRGPGEAFRHQLNGIFSSVRTLDPSRTDDGVRRTQRRARGELKRLTKQIDSRIDILNREIDRNPNALAALGERRALYGLINDYARTAAHLGPYGREVVEGLAEVLWDDAVVLESPPGRFAIWNTEVGDAPALVAQLPAARELDADSFDVAPIAAPPKVGRAAADRARAADLPQLAHIAAALPNGGVRVGELFDDDGIHFTRAPDPTEMLRRAHATNAERDVGEGAELSVLSYNIALLRYELFGFCQRRRSDRRRRKSTISARVHGLALTTSARRGGLRWRRA
jgi:hypothetical protein